MTGACLGPGGAAQVRCPRAWPGAVEQTPGLVHCSSTYVCTVPRGSGWSAGARKHRCGRARNLRCGGPAQTGAGLTGFARTTAARGRGRVADGANGRGAAWRQMRPSCTAQWRWSGHLPPSLGPYCLGWGELAFFRVPRPVSPASLLSHTLFLATSVFLPISYSTPRRPPHTLPLLSVPYRDTGAASSMYTFYVHSPDSLFVIHELHKNTHKHTHPWN